jgi:hypothetical protein
MRSASRPTADCSLRPAADRPHGPTRAGMPGSVWEPILATMFGGPISMLRGSRSTRLAAISADAPKCPVKRTRSIGDARSIPPWLVVHGDLIGGVAALGIQGRAAGSRKAPCGERGRSEISADRIVFAVLF